MTKKNQYDVKNVKITSETHRRLRILAAKTGRQINDLSDQAVTDLCDRLEGLNEMKRRRRTDQEERNGRSIGESLDDEPGN